ncbi:hypothetical protein ACFFGT_10310 [Mucilaginibacter angelicae]|uniref:Uncharacterized protein n=1 Tax=Mucilaginibacter angelicae TaxID=869718 RepID=A0ABV6L584_9SPHI
MELKDLQNYPFDWLDEIIETSLNPECAMEIRASPEKLAGWQQRLGLETSNIWKGLKSQTFLLLSRKKIETMLIQYQESLEELKRQAMVNMAAYPEDDPLGNFCGQVLSELEKLQTQFLRRYAGYLNRTGAGKISRAGAEAQPPLFKVTCRLSVDQIAIILKAADDTRLLAARSFSLVLRSITPYLSTERMQDFSWKSARSSTMKMEERDKQLTIAALEQMIKKIRDY